MADGTLLAGPMVRRSTPDAVHLWVATDGEATVRAEVYDVAAIQDTLVPSPDAGFVVAPGPVPAPLGSTDVGTTESRRLGPRLCVHLLTVRPLEERFPTDTLLGYDLEIDGKRLADLGLTEGPGAITYPALPVPTFVLASKMRRLLHGSCRKLHGEGEDAFANADVIIESTLRRPGERPPVLFLTGDQIYADDVGDRVFPVVRTIAEQLMPGEPVPGLPPLHLLGAGTRAAFLAGVFTSGEAGNHVLGFGEYAALYLLAFSPDLYALGVDTEEVFGPDGQRVAVAVRRVLANIVTYMAFDDHEITDDWNINADWRKRVEKPPTDKPPTGRRIVANGLAAYWAFQGWGNDPAAFDDGFKDDIERRLQAPGDEGAGDRFDATLWEFDSWAYAAPTRPPALVMDLRTRRGREQTHLDTVELLDPRTYPALDAALAAVGHRWGQPLVLVSPAPVLGHTFVERLQDHRSHIGLAIEGLGIEPTTALLDAESWAAHRAGLPNLLGWLATRTKACVVLSGDVHYGFHAHGVFDERGNRLVVVQLTSSPLKNLDHKAVALRVVDTALGFAEGEEVGWRRPPARAAEILLDALVAAFPKVAVHFPEAGEPGAPAADDRDTVVHRLLQDETVWWLLQALLANDEPDAAVVRFDRLLSEYKRLVHPRRASEPLSLPVEIADDLRLPREDWRLERSFVPVAGGFARRQNVVQETNVGDVRLGLEEGWVDSTLTTRAGDGVGDVARARINLWGRPAAGRRRSGLTAVGDDLADLKRVARHMVDWRLASEDEMWGKRQLEFGDFRLKALPLDVLPGGRWDHVKTQVHSISFRLAGTSVPELGDHLADRFERLIPADQATLVIEPPARLALGSEIRWTVAPLAITDPVQRIIDQLVARLAGVAAISTEAADVIQRAFNYKAAGLDPSHRNFDVRVGAVTEPTPNLFGFTVVTLSNHPYGGGRSWQIVRHGDGLYSLTTAEFNTYAWLPDAVFELATVGESTRRLWYSQLRNFVADVGGQPTRAADPTLAAIARAGDAVVDHDTSFLFGGQDTSETAPGFTQAVNRSPLGNWVRLNFPTLGAMVDAVFPPLPQAAAQ